jgi:hypothetical protein
LKRQVKAVAVAGTGRVPFLNRSVLDAFHALMTIQEFCAARGRRDHTPEAARTSITSVDGSGTAALAIAPALLPGGEPKCDLHRLYPAGVPFIFRQTT